MKHLAPMRNLLTFAVLFMSLMGCATLPKLTAADQAHFQAVKIDPVVKYPPTMTYMGEGAHFGLLGALADIPTRKKLQKFVEAHNIHVNNIVKKAATKAFEQSGKLNLTDAAGPRVATLKIVVRVYGLGMHAGFSSKLRPFMNIRCSLIDPTGQVIWKADDFVDPNDSVVTAHTMAQLKAHPKLIAQEWRGAANYVMAKIVRHM